MTEEVGRLNFSSGGPDERTGDRPPRGVANGQPDGGPKQEDIPVTVVVLASVGGMVLFLGSFFALVVGLGVGGFLIPALIALGLGGSMVLGAWRMWRKRQIHHEISEQQEKERLLCDYCGGLNSTGDLQCRFCGAPLR